MQYTVTFDAVKKKERDMSLFKSRRTGLIDFFVNIILLLSAVYRQIQSIVPQTKSFICWCFEK